MPLRGNSVDQLFNFDPSCTESSFQLVSLFLANRQRNLCNHDVMCTCVCVWGRAEIGLFFPEVFYIFIGTELTLNFQSHFYLLTIVRPFHIQSGCMFSKKVQRL